MRTLPSISALVALAMALAFALAQPGEAASSKGRHSAHSKIKAKTAALSRAHAVQSSRAHGKVRPTSRPETRVQRRLRMTAQRNFAQSVHPSRRVRRGVLAAARRRAHTEDAAPRRLERVHLALPPPLRGSHESLVHQNEMAEADNLERILDDADLEDRIAHGSLVPVPLTAGLHINSDLPENRRYCRPWTAKFLADLDKAHALHFAGSFIEVTSAVRTVEYQRQLRQVNGNAAAADGDIASPHLTGGTIDIAKQGLSAREIGWLRAWLIPLERQGKIDVEEEFRQSCFHISVYKNYAGAQVQPKSVAPAAAASMLPIPGR